MIWGIGGLLLLIIVIFGVSSCNHARHKSALEDYNRRVNAIGTESTQTGAEFFKELEQAGNQSPQDLQSRISSFRVQAEQQLKQAQDLSVPGNVKSAQESLLTSLQLRRDGLDQIARDIRTALGDEGDAADAAIRRMAGNMRYFDGSDALYDARVIPFIKDALTEAKISPTIQTSRFLTDIEWLLPTFIADKLGQRLNETEGGGTSNQPTGPGLHGTGLNGTSYGDVTLQPGTTNRLTYAQGQPISVSFTNQGDNDEFNVKVTLKITPAAGGGSPITVNQTVQKVAKGEKATVELPLNRKPPLDTALNLQVTVAGVPGETKTDNNKATYPTLFVSG